MDKFLRVDLDDAMVECDRPKGDHATFKWLQEIFHKNMNKAIEFENWQEVEGFRDCNSFDVVLYSSFEVFVAVYDFCFLYLYTSFCRSKLYIFVYLLNTLCLK